MQPTRSDFAGSFARGRLQPVSLSADDVAFDRASRLCKAGSCAPPHSAPARGFRASVTWSRTASKAVSQSGDSAVQQDQRDVVATGTTTSASDTHDPLLSLARLGGWTRSASREVKVGDAGPLPHKLLPQKVRNCPTLYPTWTDQGRDDRSAVGPERWVVCYTSRFWPMFWSCLVRVHRSAAFGRNQHHVYHALLPVANNPNLAEDTSHLPTSRVRLFKAQGPKFASLLVLLSCLSLDGVRTTRRAYRTERARTTADRLRCSLS